MNDCRKGIWPFVWYSHDWSKWREPYSACEPMYDDLNRPHDTYKVYQDRTCNRCGMIQSRTVRNGGLNELESAEATRRLADPPRFDTCGLKGTQ